MVALADLLEVLCVEQVIIAINCLHHFITVLLIGYLECRWF